MGLHAKWDALTSLKPDVAIVPECAEPVIVWSRRKSVSDCAAKWIGKNRHKGLGVFAFHGYSLQIHECFDPRFQYFLPLTVCGNAEFSLLAVWAFNHRSEYRGSYGAATAEALDYYEPFLRNGNAVVAGDFNNSTVWDRKAHIGNFSFTVSRFEALNMASSYHEHTRTPFGQETHYTLFFRKGLLQYHIDYCFIPRAWTTSSVVVGNREDWIALSDHAPLVVDCALSR